MPGEDSTPDNTFDLIFLQVLISFFGTVISCVNTSLVVFSLGMDLFAISTIGSYYLFSLLFVIAIVASISSWLMYDYETYMKEEFKKASQYNHSILKTEQTPYNSFALSVHLFMSFCSDFVAISTVIGLLIHIFMNAVTLSFGYYCGTVALAFYFTILMSTCRYKIILHRDKLFLDRWASLREKYEASKQTITTNFRETPWKYHLLFILLGVCVTLLCLIFFKYLIFFKNPFIFSTDFIVKIKIFEKVVGLYSMFVAVCLGMTTYQLSTSVYERKPYFHLLYGLAMFVLSFFSFSIFIQKIAVIFVQIFAITVHNIEFCNMIFWFVSLILSSFFGITIYQLKSRDRDFLIYTDLIQSNPTNQPISPVAASNLFTAGKSEKIDNNQDPTFHKEPTETLDDPGNGCTIV